MDISERYRTEAERCLSEAAGVKDRRRRAAWEDLAQRWLDLAQQLKARADHPVTKHRHAVHRTGHRRAA